MVFGFNSPVLKMLLSRGFVEEGRLRRHVFWNGESWDLHQLALYREAWSAIRARTKLQLVVQADFEQITRASGR